MRMMFPSVAEIFNFLNISVVAKGCRGMSVIMMESQGIDLQRLIEEVEGRPLLWDLSDSRYANKPLKDRAWQAVGDACGCTGPQAQARFRNLRTSYNRRRAKYLPSGSGAAAAAARPTHSLDLPFLDRVTRRGETTSNLDLPPPPSQPAIPSDSLGISQTSQSRRDDLTREELWVEEDVPYPAAVVDVVYAASESETQFDRELSQPATPITRTTATATTTTATPTTATVTTNTTATPTATAAAATSTPTCTGPRPRTCGVKRARRAADAEPEPQDPVDSQLTAELERLRQTTSGLAATGADQQLDIDCLAWGRLVSAEMQGLSPERRKAFKADLNAAVAKLY